jgi:hypothetical protein
MDKAFSSAGNEAMKHHKKTSKTNGEQSQTQFANSLEAAKLRASSPKDKIDSYHTPVQFSWRQFLITLIYENLPPVIFAPLAALLIERSTSKAWHVMNHRGLFMCSLKHNDRSNHIFCWVLMYPIYWLVFTALMLRLFGPDQLVQNVDLFQMVLAYLFFSLRALIVSVKYGYYRPEDYARLNQPAPEWTGDKTNRLLVGGGWSSPSKYPGLIEDGLTCAMDENDVALQGISFTMDTHTSAQLQQHKTDPRFIATTPHQNHDQVTAGFVLHQILSTVYHLKFPTAYGLFLMACVISILLSTFLIRLAYGIEAFGATDSETLIFIGCGIGFFGSIASLNFGLICAHDFNRRAATLKKLGQLIQFPGLRLAEFLYHQPTIQESDETIEADPTQHPNGHLFIDLNQPSNVFAWMMCRKTLRSFGEAFYLRIQAYNSILLFYAISCMVILNMIAWTQARHHVSTIYLIILIVVVISSICIFTISKATKLQMLSSSQRDQLQNQLFLLEQELMNAENAEKPALYKQIQQAKVLLQQVDESIHFHELIHKPVKVMGYPTTQNVVSSALGIILTGFVLAGKGFSGAGIVYDLQGWFNY